MFFIFSKILMFVLNPLVWILAFLLYSLWTKKAKRKRNSLLAAIFLLFFFSNEFISNQVFHWWEKESIASKDIPVGAYDVAILLGGYGNAYGLPDDGRFVFGSSASRFTETFELYKTGKIKRILLTGGKSDISQKNKSEGVAAQALLTRLGVPDSVIILESDARNTRENATFSKQMLDSLGYENCLLVTSAFHMKRASACFDKVGIDYTTYAVDYKSIHAPNNLYYFLQPTVSSIDNWRLLIKEWVGLIAYKFAGYV